MYYTVRFWVVSRSTEIQVESKDTRANIFNGLLVFVAKLKNASRTVLLSPHFPYVKRHQNIWIYQVYTMRHIQSIEIFCRNVWKLLTVTVNSKDTRQRGLVDIVLMFSLLALNRFHTCFGVSIVGFKEVNIIWAIINPIKIKNPIIRKLFSWFTAQIDYPMSPW